MKIKLEEGERELWEEALLRYLKSKDPYADEAKLKADIKTKFQRAINGWGKRCPPLLEDRIKQVFSMKKQDFLVHFMRDGKFDKFSIAPEDLKKDEESFLKKRENFYRTEFDLDDAGDKALLDIVLLEELRLYRIKRDIEKNPTLKTDYSEQLTKLNRNITNALKALGITRDQRKTEQRTPQGSVANLSLKFDERIKKFRELKKKNLKHERLLKKYIEQREAVNKITDNDVEGILKVIEERQ